MTSLQQAMHSASILTGFMVSRSDRASLPIRVARRHLRALGATLSTNLTSDSSRSDLLVAHPSAPPKEALHCSLEAWTDMRFDDERAGEAIVQAISGLMAVHGRDWGRPRRLGID